MSLTAEQKTDIKAYLIYKAELTGNSIDSEDPALDAIVDEDMHGSALQVQLLEESKIYKESL